MKKCLSILLAVIIIICSASPAFATAGRGPLRIISEAAILMDADTGQILYEKNMNERLHPASITKIMTVLLAVEQAKNLQQTINVSSTAPLYQYDVTHIELKETEVVTLEQMLYATMLMSANDASNVIAEYIGGTQQNFASMMNDKVRDLGLTNTRFENAHGLPSEGHYSTAYDMAEITREAIKNLEFVRVFGTYSYTMPATNLTRTKRDFVNMHDMLKTTSLSYYDGVVGGKLGWTEEAEHTAVTVAQKGNRKLIAVVMKSRDRDDKYRDTATLFNYGFNEFTTATIPKASLDSQKIDIVDNGIKVGEITCVVKDDFKFLIHNSVPKNLVETIYNIPPAVESANIIEHSISFKLPSTITAMYPMLGEIPIIHIKNYYGDYVSTNINPQLINKIGTTALNAFKIAAGIAIFIFAVKLLVGFSKKLYEKTQYNIRKQLLADRIRRQKRR